MSFGTRLKARREQLGITQPQLAEMLGVSKGAIGNYEIGANSPKATILFKVFDVLDCDANYLFQDEMKNLSVKDAVTPFEMDHLVKKYRELDSHGKEMVDFTLQKEYERSVAEKEKSDNIVPMTVNESSDYNVDAAHAMKNASAEDKAFDEDIMNSEDF